MKVNLGNHVEFELYQIEEARDVEALARETDGEVYSWKTVGTFNWFEKGYSIVDTLGLVILDKGLPNQISLPDDK